MSRMKPWRAVVRRELRAALANRFVHLLAGLMLAIGCLPLLDGNPAESGPYFLLQAVLYLVPLFALLIGVGAVQADLEERPFLLTQPVPRFTLAWGKWLALALPLAFCAGLLLLPWALGVGGVGRLRVLLAGAVAVGSVFLALGMACGLATSDRVKAHLGALALWVFLLAGVDLLALVALQAGYFREAPGLWLLLLMGNPLGAFRVGALFALGQVPLEMVALPPLGRWWLAHPQAWLALICTAWAAAALGWCGWRLRG